MVLSYPHAVGIFEGSWNLPRGFQQLEIFGHEGSLAMDRESLTPPGARELLKLRWILHLSTPKPAIRSGT